MKNQPCFIALALSAFYTLGLHFSTAHAQGTAFTYQGRLNSGTNAASGSYDLTFSLFNVSSGGSAVAGPLTNSATSVSNGLFLATLDFGGVFNGANRWLEIGVRTNGNGAFTTLAPRQPVTPAPYAIFSAGAAVSASLSGTLAASQLTGILPQAQLPGNIVTNNATGLNLTGSFAGDGSALSNVTAIVLTIPPGMALIPAGTFTMGNSIGDSDITNASPTDVTVSAFYMDVNLVSWSQWSSLYFWATNHGYNFSLFANLSGVGTEANNPKCYVDWYDAVKWCNARSQQAGLTPVYFAGGVSPASQYLYTNGEPAIVVGRFNNNGFRLPTEAEWEKAARGGLSGQRFPWGNVISENLANYSGNTNRNYDVGPTGSNAIWNSVSPVGSFAPNGYGLFDMAGNVAEWCWDWYGTPYLGGSDPRGPATGILRVLRSGSFGLDAAYARCANRNYDNPNDYGHYDISFRCVRRP